MAGEFEQSDSPYGTFDQGGNLWEWNETIIGEHRCLRGGSFNDRVGCMLASYRFGCNYSSAESDVNGFRVVEVPEPASMMILVLGGIGMLVRRNRK
jgi:formylglycine-generating enzyme